MDKSKFELLLEFGQAVVLFLTSINFILKGGLKKNDKRTNCIRFEF